MKKLLAILLLGAATAHAGTVFYTSNEGGGVIALTDMAGTCPAGTNVVYSTTMQGSTAPLVGCWKYEEPFVHVVWPDGTVRNWPAANFQITEYGKNKYSGK